MSFCAVQGFHFWRLDEDTHFTYDTSLRNRRIEANIYELQDWIERLPGAAGYLDMSAYGL